MFCKNCGNQMDDAAAVCVKCGVAAGQGVNYCPNCGTQAVPGAAVCTQCGVVLGDTVIAPENQKSKIAAGLLAIFLGGIGVHNFYLGYTGKAVAQLLIFLLTCSFGGIITGVWALIEAIMIFTGSINKDGKGVPLKD